MRPFVLAALAALALAGCSDPSCKNACDQLRTCNFDTGGISCDESCKEPDSECATCINDESDCAKLSESCASKCTGVSFAAKK